MNFQYLKDRDLASQISARICHDLISPIGAIRNGLELLELSGISTTAEFGLVAESVEIANARIEFFRLAFGKTDDTFYPSARIRETLRAYYNDSRRVVDWMPRTDLKRSTVKPIFLALLSLEDLLPKGGQISIHSDGRQSLIKARAETITFDVDLWDRFKKRLALEDSHASRIHLPLFQLELICQELDFDIEVDAQEAAIRLMPSAQT